MPGKTHPSPFPERRLSQRALLQKMLVSCLVLVQAAGTDPVCKRFGRAEQHSAQPSGYRCLLRRGAEQLLQGTAPSSQQHLNELGNRGCVGWHREDSVVEAKSNSPARVKAQLSACAESCRGAATCLWGSTGGWWGGSSGQHPVGGCGDCGQHWLCAEVILQQMARAEILLLLCTSVFPVSSASES